MSIGTIFLCACNTNSDNKPANFNPADLLNDTTKAENFSTIKWLDSTVDFGVATKGEKVKTTFRFLNSGTNPLYIIYVKPGCGCTVADFTKGAVMPGKQGIVTAQYDTNHGNAGEVVHKNLYVTCNARPQSLYTLSFTGMVKDSTK